MGATHAEGWKSLASEGVELVGVVANRPDGTGDRLAKQHGFTVYDTYEQLLKDVDVIDICAPTNLHRELVLAAAAAGKHILCEKPIALNLADGREMIEACKRANVRLFIAMVVRFFAQYRAAQRVVTAGEIGQPCVIRLTRVAYQPRKAFDNWFLDEARSGGMILDMMIHDFDYARWLAGDVTRVFAKSVRSNRPDAPGDYALVTLRFAGGAIGHIEGGWAYPEGIFRTGMDIAGRDGVIEWKSDHSDTVRTYLSQPPAQQSAEVGLPVSATSESPYTTEIRHFYDALVHNKPFDVTPEDSLAALQIALAARESAKTGRGVTINQEAI
jgi:predicted dehydrogenase